MRRALPLLFAPAVLSCTLLRDLDDLPGDDGAAASTAGAGGGCTFGANGGSGAAADNPGDPVAGCADGTRELFVDPAMHPDIAGCSGGFALPGLASPESRTPQCGRNAGNHGAEPIGWGCNAADLCSLGWHVCESAAEIAVKSSHGACAGDGIGFWATRQSQDDDRACTATGVNNLVGCGVGIGEAPHASCSPLTVELREIHCNDSCAWLCDGDVVYNEAQIVQKYGADEGGVLCCRD